MSGEHFSEQEMGVILYYVDLVIAESYRFPIGKAWLQRSSTSGELKGAALSLTLVTAMKDRLEYKKTMDRLLSPGGLTLYVYNDLGRKETFNYKVN